MNKLEKIDLGLLAVAGIRTHKHLMAINLLGSSDSKNIRSSFSKILGYPSGTPTYSAYLSAIANLRRYKYRGQTVSLVRQGQIRLTAHGLRAWRLIKEMELNTLPNNIFAFDGFDTTALVNLRIITFIYKNPNCTPKEVAEVVPHLGDVSKRVNYLSVERFLVSVSGNGVASKTSYTLTDLGVKLAKKIDEVYK